MNLRELNQNFDNTCGRIATSIGDMDAGTFFLILFLTPIAIGIWCALRDKWEEKFNKNKKKEDWDY